MPEATMERKQTAPFKSSLAKLKWTVEDFVIKARARGIVTRVTTAQKWCRGAQPRLTVREDIRREFGGKIRF